MNPKNQLANAQLKRREAIIDAALEMVSRQGVEGMRLADVAERAGVSIGLVQHYFRRRQTLIGEVFDRLLQESLASWAAVHDDEPDPVRRLFLLVRLTVGRGEEFRREWSLWFELSAAATRDDELRVAAQGQYELWLKPFSRAVEEGIGAGRFTTSLSPDDAAIRLISLAEGLAWRVLLEQLGVDEERMFEILIESACETLNIDPTERDQALADLRV